MQAPGAGSITLLVLLPLVAWRVYSRVRRMVGRQKLSPWRSRTTLVVFPLLIATLALLALAHPVRLLLLAAGAGAGIALSIYGIRRTKFEAVPGALYYTPNAHLGIALSMLLVARIGWRLYQVYALGAEPSDSTDFARSPATLAVFGLLAGYYCGYAVGLLRWRGSVLRAKREREAAVQSALPAEEPKP